MQLQSWKLDIVFIKAAINTYDQMFLLKIKFVPLVKQKYNQYYDG